MADRIQLRRDTAANWTNYNPILLEGEPGIELDTDQWKLGDGIHNWNNLPYRGGPYVQQRGQSTTAAMSQKAVTDELNLIAVFDISAYNLTDGQPTKYADLAAALGTNGANVPESFRRGGMTVKYVQSSDNKYVQARCMAQNFTTDVTQWQRVDDVPTAGSNNLVKSGGVYNYVAFLDDVVGIKRESFVSVNGGGSIVNFDAILQKGVEYLLSLQANGVLSSETSTCVLYSNFGLSGEKTIISSFGNGKSVTYTPTSDNEVLSLYVSNNDFASPGDITLLFGQTDNLSEKVGEIEGLLDISTDKENMDIRNVQFSGDNLISGGLHDFIKYTTCKAGQEIMFDVNCTTSLQVIVAEFASIPAIGVSATTKIPVDITAGEDKTIYHTAISNGFIGIYYLDSRCEVSLIKQYTPSEAFDEFLEFKKDINQINPSVTPHIEEGLDLRTTGIISGGPYDNIAFARCKGGVAVNVEIRNFDATARTTQVIIAEFSDKPTLGSVPTQYSAYSISSGETKSFKFTPDNDGYVCSTVLTSRYGIDSFRFGYILDEAISTLYQDVDELKDSTEEGNDSIDILNTIYKKETYNNSNISNIVKELVREGCNLLSTDNLSKGLLLNADGSFTENDSFWTSDLILIKPSTSYSTKQSYGFIGFYDINKEWIKRSSFSSSTPVVSPDNAYYVKVCSNSSLYCLYEGDAPETYEAWFKPYLKVNEKTEPMVSFEHSLELTSESDIAAIIEGLDTNIKISQGKRVRDIMWQIQAKFDTLVANFPSIISKIDLVGSGYITFAVNDLVEHEDVLYKCLTACDDTAWDSLKFTALPNWVSGYNYSVDDIVFHDRMSYKCVTQHTSSSTFDATKWEVVLHKYFGYPRYTRLNGVADEYYTYDCPNYHTYLYRIKGENQYVGNADGGFFPKKKLLIVGNTHGTEIAGSINTFILAYLLCQPKQQDYFSLFQSFDVYIIPTLNGYGSYADTRYNANHVDINRNYPIKKWQKYNEGTENFTGYVAGSEFETQLVMGLCNKVGFDIAIDHHNYWPDLPKEFYTEIMNPDLLPITYQCINDLSFALIKAYPQYFGTIPQMLLQQIESAPGALDIDTRGTHNAWFYESGIKVTATLEICKDIAYNNGIPVKDGSSEIDSYGSKTFAIGQYSLIHQLCKFAEFSLRYNNG